MSTLLGLMSAVALLLACIAAGNAESKTCAFAISLWFGTVAVGLFSFGVYLGAHP